MARFSKKKALKKTSTRSRGKVKTHVTNRKARKRNTKGKSRRHLRRNNKGGANNGVKGDEKQPDTISKVKVTDEYTYYEYSSKLGKLMYTLIDLLFVILPQGNLLEGTTDEKNHKKGTYELAIEHKINKLFPKISENNKQKLKILLKKLLDILYGNDITKVVLDKKYNDEFDYTGGSLQSGGVGSDDMVFGIFVTKDMISSPTSELPEGQLADLRERHGSLHTIVKTNDPPKFLDHLGNAIKINELSFVSESSESGETSEPNPTNSQESQVSPDQKKSADSVKKAITEFVNVTPKPTIDHDIKLAECVAKDIMKFNALRLKPPNEDTFNEDFSPIVMHNGQADDIEVFLNELEKKTRKSKDEINKMLENDIQETYL